MLGPEAETAQVQVIAGTGERAWGHPEQLVSLEEPDIQAGFLRESI